MTKTVIIRATGAAGSGKTSILRFLKKRFNEIGIKTDDYHLEEKLLVKLEPGDVEKLMNWEQQSQSPLPVLTFENYWKIVTEEAELTNTRLRVREQMESIWNQASVFRRKEMMENAVDNLRIARAGLGK